MGITTRGLPYPEPTDPVAAGADAIKALALAVDPKLTGRAKVNVTTDGFGWFAIPAATLGLTTVAGGVASVSDGTAINQILETLLCTVVQSGSSGTALVGRVSKVWITAGPSGPAGFGFMTGFSCTVNAFAWGT